MTKSEMIQKVIGKCGRPDKASLIGGFLNDALLSVSKLHQWDDLHVNLDIDLHMLETQVTLPLDLDHIIELRLIVPASPTLSFPMEQWRKRQFVGVFPNVSGSTITGRPLYCYKDNSTLYLDRKSNGEYTIRMTYYRSALFFGETEESPLTHCDEALIAYATAEVYRSIQMYSDAGVWDGRFSQLINLTRQAEEREVGVHFVAQPWSRKKSFQVNQPWMDPFEGHKQ